MKQDRHAEAVDQFHEAERRDGSNPFTLANLAECALLRGDPETASKLLDRIDELDDKRKAELSARVAALHEVVSTGKPPLV